MTAQGELRRVFLADQSLRDFGGHCYAYLAPLRDVLDRRGTRAVLLGHRDLDETLRCAGAVPAFSLMADDQAAGRLSRGDASTRSEIVRGAHEDAIRADLGRIDRLFAFSAGDVLVLNTLRHWPIRGIMAWLEAIDPARRPRLWLILHYSGQPDPFRPGEGAALYRAAFEAIERSPARHRIGLAADASTLIDEFGALTSLPIRLAPFPHSSLPVRPAWDGRRIRISLAGEARRDKGFHLLPFLADRLASLAPDLRVELHVQSFIGNPDQAFFRDAEPYLRSMGDVILYGRPLSPAEYEAFMTGSDLVLLPYGRMHYHRQTSGAFAEARGMGIPVVATRGTWMARELTEAGGGALCRPDDPVSLLEATRRVCRDYGRFDGEARRAAAAWRSVNSPEKLLDMLLGEAPGDAAAAAAN